MNDRHELSAPYAWFYRWLIPAALTLVAIVALWQFLGWEGEIRGGDGDFFAALAVAAAAVFIARIFDRAKRVWVAGDKLVVCDYRQTIELPLAEVESVVQTPWLWPNRVRVHFRRATPFGTSVAFFPSLRLPSASRHPVISELENAADCSADNTPESDS